LQAGGAELPKNGPLAGRGSEKKVGTVVKYNRETVTVLG